METGTDPRSQLIDFLWRSHSLGRRTIREVLKRYDSLSAFRSAPQSEVEGCLRKLGPRVLPKIFAVQRAADLPACAYPFFTQEDAIYPQAFRPLHDPPCLVYYRGDLKVLEEKRPRIGVVGTRFASRYALQVCRQILGKMSPYQPVVVSGMALGVDGMAHQGALDQGLKTVGILGTCIDQDYPPVHAVLFREVEKKGLLLSELPPGAPMGPWRFPERNRLIAALADILIVVEAPEKSGALITAREALELGKDIYVVPGPFDSEQNIGGHKLIQDGANLLWNLEEVFKKYEVVSSLPSVSRSAARPETFLPPLEETEAKILNLFQREALHVDKVTDLSQLPAPQVSGILMKLALHGYLRELPGKFFEIL